jgi:hypothetical protein
MARPCCVLHGEEARVARSRLAARGGTSSKPGRIREESTVQAVNGFYAVFDKRTAKMLPTYPRETKTLFPTDPTDPASACSLTNGGDPIVRFDHLTTPGRWVISMLLAPQGGHKHAECIAISRSDDPTDDGPGFDTYVFYYDEIPGRIDYPKMGLGPDAYYFTYDRLEGSPITPISPLVCGLERDKMLLGQPARQVCRLVDSSEGTVLPADLDGSDAPSSGSVDYLLSQGPIDSPMGRTKLRFWKFKVLNWDSDSAALEGAFNVTVDPYVRLADPAVPQPGSNNLLFTLSKKLMNRFVYRRFAGHESLLVSHAVDDPGPGTRAGVRWYELRCTPTCQQQGVIPTVHQQETYAPSDGAVNHWRWMSSIAMDGSGNIALGFSISSGALFPSIRFAGRLASDTTPGLRGEGTIFDGEGSQCPNPQQNCGLWGDYTSMSIDPVDDCTFWYTNEHYPEGGGVTNWLTQVGVLKPPGCP